MPKKPTVRSKVATKAARTTRLRAAARKAARTRRLRAAGRKAAETRRQHDAARARQRLGASLVESPPMPAPAREYATPPEEPRRESRKEEPTRRVSLTPDDFPDRALLRGFEGGAVYAGDRGGKFYVIEDESTMADFLSDEDLADLKDDLVKVLEFDTAAGRATYIRERGWDTLDPRTRVTHNQTPPRRVSRSLDKTDDKALDEQKGEPVQLKLWGRGGGVRIGTSHPPEPTTASAPQTGRLSPGSIEREVGASPVLVAQKIEPAGAGINDAHLVVTSKGEKFVFKPGPEPGHGHVAKHSRPKAQSALAEALKLFETAGLGFPPIPSELAIDFTKCGNWCFASRPVRSDPYNWRPYVEEARRGSVCDYVLLAHSGHGVNSYAISYYLVRKPLLLFVQVGWGGVYMNADRAASEVKHCFSLCHDLVKSAKDAIADRRWRRRDRMFILATSFYGGTMVFPDTPKVPLEKLEPLQLLPEQILTRANERIRSPSEGRSS